MQTRTAEAARQPGKTDTGPEPTSSHNVARLERPISVLVGGTLFLAGVRRGGIGGGAQSIAGAFLAARGISGHCPIYRALGAGSNISGDAGSVPASRMVHVQKGYTVNRPANELYAFWRTLENLPGFMKHLESVTDLGEGRSRWVAHGPLGAHVEWEAEIVDEDPGHFIAWRSVEGSSVANSGRVAFESREGGHGTEVRVSIEYAPPAGTLGDIVARLFGESPEQQLEEDLRRFKQMVEAGEIPTTDGQSSGRSSTRSGGEAESTTERSRA